MDFSDALIAIKNKQRARRTIWPDGTYLFSRKQHGHDTFVVREETDGKPQYFLCHLSNEPIFAEDWEIVEDASKVQLRNELTQLNNLIEKYLDEVF